MDATPKISGATLFNWEAFLPTPISPSTTPSIPISKPFPNLEEQLDESRLTQKEMALKILANFLGGGLATGGKKPLDGMQPIHIFETWCWILKELLASIFVNDQHVETLLNKMDILLKQSIKQKELFNRFSQKEFIEMVKNYSDKIKNLKTGESYPFFGGWGNIGGGSGHALMYQVERNSDNSFNFRLYTPIDFQLAQVAFCGEKRKIFPVVSWENIPEDYLLASPKPEEPPVFFQHLFEMDWCISNYDKNAVISEIDILEALDYLAPYKKQEQDNARAKSGQKGGTCLPSSLRVWMEYQFKSLAEFKNFRLHSEVILLRGLYQELEKHLEKEEGLKGEKERALFISVAQKQIGTIDKLVSKQAIDQDFAFNTIRQLNNSISLLKKTSQNFTLEQRQRSQSVHVTKLSTQPQQTQRSQDRYWVEESVFRDPRGVTPSTLPTYLTLSGENFLSFLKEVCQCVEEKVKNNKTASYKQAANLSLHHAIDQLKVPPKNKTEISPWANLDLQTLLECCQTLRTLGVSYAKNSMDEDLPPRRFATSFKIYALIHHLGSLIDQKRGKDRSHFFENYCTPFQADKLNQIDGLTFHTIAEFETIEAVKTYFADQNSGKSLVFSSEISTEIVKDSIHASLGNATLWNALMRSNQAFADAVNEEATRRFPDYTETEIGEDWKKQEEAIEAWLIEEKAYFNKSEKERRLSYLPPRPPNPRKLQNIPHLTKQMLVIEEFDSRKEKMGNPLLADFFPEINEMRLFSSLNSLIQNAGGYPTDLTRKAERDRDHHKVKCNIFSNIYEERPEFFSTNWANFIEAKYYPSFRDYRSFFDHTVLRRDSSEWKQPTAEALALEEKKLPPLLHQSLRTLSEWKLTPNQLLLEWGKNFEFLKDPALQGVFFRLFFRSPIQDKQVHLGVGDLITDSDTLANIKTFVSQGLSYFMQLKQKDKNEYSIHHIEGVKFLFEFTFLCQKYLLDLNREDLIESIDFREQLEAWIEDTTISRTPRTLLRLYRILDISIKNPAKKLSKEDLRQILLDWSVVHLYSDGKKPSQISSLSFSLADNFIASAITHHQEVLDKTPADFCESILKESVRLPHLTWEICPDGASIYKGLTQTKEQYHIDLRRGEILTPTGRASRVISHRSWESDPHFKRIFGENPSFDYTMGGEGAITFTHPTQGTFRILLKKYYGANLIQKSFRGEWYQHIPEDQISKEIQGLSKAFAQDHVIWAQMKVEKVETLQVQKIVPSTTSPETVHVFIKFLDGRCIQLELDINQTLEQQVGLLAEKFPTEMEKIAFIFAGKVLSLNTCLVDFNVQRASTLHAVLPSLKIDTENILHLRREPDHSLLPPEAPLPVNLYNFKAIITDLRTGKAVWAIKEKGEILEVAEKEDFVAPVQEDLSTHYLESLTHGLEKFEDSDDIVIQVNQSGETEKLDFVRLRSLDGNPLVFIKKDNEPHLVWKDNEQYALTTISQGFFQSYEQYLYLTPKNKKDPALLIIPFVRFCDQAIPPESWRSIPYFVYQVRDYKLIPQSLEARLHLAYLLYQEEHYESAIEHLRSLKPIDKISPLGFLILDRIIKAAPPIDHPNAAMCPLWATLISIKEKNKQTDEPIDFHFGETHEDLRNLYNLVLFAYQSLELGSHISQDCCMSKQDKKFLVSLLVRETTKKIDLFEKNHINYPESLIAYLTYWLKNPSQSEIQKLKRRETPKSRKTDPLKKYSFELPMLYLGKDEKEKEKYSSQERLATIWLTSGQIPFLVSRWPLQEGGNLKENGNLLTQVLRIGKNGTIHERLAMLWKVRNWRLHWRGQDDHLPFLDLLINILIKPKDFPNPPEKNASPFEKMSYLQEIQIAQTIYGNDFSTTISSYLGNPKPSFARKMTLPALASSPLESLESFGRDPIPLMGKVLGKYDEARLNTLKSWATSFCTQEKSEKPSKSQPPFSLKKGLLSQEEQSYQAQLEKDLATFAADFDEGDKQLEEQKNLTVTQADQFLQALTVEKEVCLEELANKEKEALNLLNRLPLPFNEFMHRVALDIKGRKKSITLDQARDALLSFDKRAFKLLNPTLTDDEITGLSQLLIDREDLNSWKLQLERIEELVEKQSLLADSQDPTKKDLCRRLLQELESAYHFTQFDVESQVVFRIFCGQTGLIPFKKQIDLIERMLRRAPNDLSSFQDCICQLIMGGGKTSVIAALLMQFFARQKGKIALFVLPQNLLKSVSCNLTDALKTSFNQTMEVIDVRRHELTPYKLNQILEILRLAQENPIVVATTPSSIQIISLEFKSQIRKLKENLQELNNYRAELNSPLEKSQELAVQRQIQELSKIAQERVDKARQLATIQKTLSEDAQALMDEVDIILDALLEFNFPDGIKMPISPEDNNLAYTIFSYCMQDDLKIKTPSASLSLREALNLSMNLQEEVLTSAEKKTFEIRCREALSVLANKLTSSFAPFQTIPRELKPSLHRFLTRQIPGYIQDFADSQTFQLTKSDLTAQDRDWEKSNTLEQLQLDCHFLNLLNDRAKSDNKKEKQFSQLVERACLIFTILPDTLSKNAKRNYGPVPGNPYGKICPYTAVDDPAIDREFGYVWEELCYYYQWACLKAPEPAVILELARLATEAAHYYMRKNKELFHETAEYQQFKDLTGCKLEDFQDPHSNICKAAVLNAQNNLQKDSQKRLSLQKELAANQVKMTSFHLSGNGFSLCRALRSRRGMTGTPRGVEGYRESLATNFIPDKGTEGKVLATLVKKVTANHLHKVNLTPNMKDLLGKVFSSSPSPLKIRGFIDAGGLLKIWPNIQTVVTQTVNFLQEEKKNGRVNEAIDTILFFQSGTLYMWKIGAPHPEKVGATTSESLKAKGLEPKQCFTLYGEKEVTGIDILQDPEAVNIFTFDPKMLLRTVPQGAMRLRQLLFSQNIEIVLDNKTTADIFNQGSTIEDLLLQAAKNQSKRNTIDMLRYYKMQVADIFETYAVKPLLDLFTKENWSENSFLDLMKQAEAYFVHTLQDNLHEQFGRLSQEAPTKTTLLNRLENLTHTFPFLSQEVTKEVDALKKRIETAPLPPTMKTSCENLGMESAIEVEAAVEVDVNVEQEQQTDTEIEDEIERELQLYENIERSEYRQVQPIDYDQFCALIEQLKSDSPRLISLSDQLKKFKYGLADKRKHYEKAFSQPIYGTESYFNTCTYLLPVFHSLQRPPTQILAVKTDKGFKWLLVSEHEANSLKEIFKEHTNLSDVWLIQPDGSPLAPSSIPFPFDNDDENILNGLLEINAFNGNADWLGYYEHYLGPWLLEDTELKLDFLKLRTARHPHQRQILAYLPTILRLSAEHQIDLKSTHMIFSARAIKESRDPQDIYTPSSILETKLLRSMKQIEQLQADWIGYLGIDPNQTDEATKDALKSLITKNADADEHSRTQIKYLKASQIEHLKSYQLKWMHKRQVAHLKHPFQIMTMEQGIPHYFLNQEQVEQLDSHQGHLIPFIDPQFYPCLSLPEHIQNIPIPHLDKIDPKYVCHLSSAQIKEGFNTEELLRKYKQNILPNQWQYIHGNLIEHIPPDKVTSRHIGEITDPKLKREWQEKLADKTKSISFWEALKTLSPDQVKNRTFLQRTIHVLALSIIGILSKMALWVRIASFLRITQKCELYSNKLDEFKTTGLTRLIFYPRAS